MLSKTVKKGVIRHEVGHWIVAKVLNFEPSQIRLAQKGGGADLNLVRGTNTIEEVMVFLEQRVQVLYAGLLSEKSCGDNPMTEAQQQAAAKLRFSTARDDSQKIQQLLPVLRNIRYPSTTDEEQARKEMNMLENELWGNTVKLVDLNRPKINHLEVEILKMWTSANLTVSGENLNEWFER